MFPAVFQTLKAVQAIKDVVGTNPPRIYRHGRAPQDVTKPYVTWLTFGEPENQLSGAPPCDRVAVQIDAWHQTDAGVELLATAIRDAVEPHAHMTRFQGFGREAETNLYRVMLEFDWFLNR